MPDRERLEANKRIGRRVLLKIWGQGKLAGADELISPEYVDHTPAGPEPQVVHGPKGIKEAVKLFRKAFPDLSTRLRSRWLNATS